MTTKCSSYQRGEYHCKDGHVQTAACAGVTLESIVPTCCNEILCGRLYEHNGGKPSEKFVDNKEVK